MNHLIIAIILVCALVLPVSAANVFVSTVVVGMSTRSAGDYSFNSVAVPTGVQGLLLFIDLSEAVEPLPAMSAALEGSLDGGTTWAPAGAFSRPAGLKTVIRGITIQSSGASFTGGDFWSDTTNVNRRLRGSASISGSMRFSLTVQPL